MQGSGCTAHWVPPTSVFGARSASQGQREWTWQNPSAAGTSAGSGQFAANGSFSDNLAYADREKERTFIDSITSGVPHNQIAAGVETALSCMLGRMAGYTRREVTWEDFSPMARPISWE